MKNITRIENRGFFFKSTKIEKQPEEYNYYKNVAQRFKKQLATMKRLEKYVNWPRKKGNQTLMYLFLSLNLHILAAKLGSALRK